jgi:membrane protein
LTRLEQMIWRSAPVSFLTTKSRKLVIPGFRGLPLYDVARFFFRQVKKVGLNERAAAISFNLIMALPAGFLFLFSLIPYFPKSANLQKEILNIFKDIAPNSETHLFIENLVNDLLLQPHAGVFSFGFLALMFYTSNAMIGIIRSFDRSIEERTRKFFLHKRLRAIRLTMILIVLVLISTFLLLVGKEQMIYLMRHVFKMRRADRIAWWNGVRWVIIVALLFYGIALVYKFAPSLKKRWKLVSPGSILAASLTLINLILFSYWVTNFGSYNKVYGSIGTMLIIMVLIYINSLILLIGFELNVSIAYLTREAEQRIQKEEAELEKKVLDHS